MHCKSTPVNKGLYNRIKNKVKKRSKVWPSAYASGQLVREYKSKGGKYRCSFGSSKRSFGTSKRSFGSSKRSFGSLDRWFKEKWVNVCKRKGKGYAKCGRSKSSKKNYPYCRPSKRVSSQTPRTVGEIGKSKLKQMCKRKNKKPYSKIFVHFGASSRLDQNIKYLRRLCAVL